MSYIEISIIVPVYNVESYFDRCIKSILSQTYKDFELLLIDDGSTDKSGKLCDKYMEIDARIRAIHQENRGVSTARNVGIENSIGKYIVFIDSDDWIDESYLESLYEAAEQNRSDIVFCGARIEEKFSCWSEYQPSKYIDNNPGITYREKIILNYVEGNGFIGVPWARIYRKGFLARSCG